MMNRTDLDSALAIARSDRALDLDDLALFDGFGLPDFRPVTCTIDALAALVRWQCVRFDGSIDGEALDEIARYGRHRFAVLHGADKAVSDAAA